MTIDIFEIIDIATRLYDVIAQHDDNETTRDIIDTIERDFYDDDDIIIDHVEIVRARKFVRAFCVKMIDVIDARTNDDDDKTTTLARCSNR